MYEDTHKTLNRGAGSEPIMQDVHPSHVAKSEYTTDTQ